MLALYSHVRAVNQHHQTWVIYTAHHFEVVYDSCFSSHEFQIEGPLYIFVGPIFKRKVVRKLKKRPFFLIGNKHAMPIYKDERNIIHVTQSLKMVILFSMHNRASARLMLDVNTLPRPLC